MKNASAIFFGIILLGLGVAIGWLMFQRESRPCVLAEREIARKYGDAAPADETARILRDAGMYNELWESGCPENKKNYEDRVRRAVAEWEALAVKQAAVVTSEIKIDTAKVKDAVNEATRVAAEAMGEVLDTLKNTKINITVE